MPFNLNHQSHVIDLITFFLKTKDLEFISRYLPNITLQNKESFFGPGSFDSQ